LFSNPDILGLAEGC